MEITIKEELHLCELRLYSYKKAFDMLANSYRCMNNPVARQALKEAKNIIKENQKKEKNYKPWFLGGENIL